MTQFEHRLEAELSQDDAAFLANLEREQGLFEQMGSTFSGPLRYWTAFAFVLSFAFFLVGVYAAVQMVQASDAKSAVVWSAGFGAMMLSVSMIKIWFWMRMNHLAVLKELKLIQLQISQSQRPS